jgi:hypothetical protein
LASLAGCGTTLSRGGTEQLLASDAVDRAISTIDFRVLSQKKVFFDSQYIKHVKEIGFVNADYIIGSLRQQLAAAECLLQDKPEDADYVVEARVGALGTDGHELIYGIPANNLLNAATSLMPTLPSVPTIPEISLAKRNDQRGAFKLGVFAYHRETKQPVWQSGITVAKSTSKDTWIFGAGPFQRGTIYEGTQFAGTKIEFPLLAEDGTEGRGPAVSYAKEHHFPNRISRLSERKELHSPTDSASRSAKSAEQALYEADAQDRNASKDALQAAKYPKTISADDLKSFDDKAESQIGHSR